MPIARSVRSLSVTAGDPNAWIEAGAPLEFATAGQIVFGRGSSGDLAARVAAQLAVREACGRLEENLLLELRYTGSLENNAFNFDAALPHAGLVIYRVIEGDPSWHGGDYDNITGGSIPAEMWHDYMLAATADDGPCEIPTEVTTTVVVEGVGYAAQAGDGVDQAQHARAARQVALCWATLSVRSESASPRSSAAV